MISQKRYVNITSGVGGGAGVRTRQLVLRIVTTNNKLLPNELKEFTNADDVMAFFGDGSEEYKRAVRYFGFISKSITAPQMISFVRWAKTATPPSVKANTVPVALATIKGFKAAKLQFNNGTKTFTSSAMDLSGAGITDYAAVAAAMTASTSSITDATISSGVFSFDPATGLFSWTGAPGTSSVAVKFDVVAGNEDIGAATGLSASDALVAAGYSAETAVECISRTTEQDNNFGSFLFTYESNVDSKPGGKNGEVTTEIAQWNKSQNNMYMYLVGVEQQHLTESALVSPDSVVSGYKGIAGLAVTAVKDGAPSTYDEQIPGEILAATDYTQPNCTQNYMFYQFADRVPTVETNADADRYDLQRVNYIGRTQTAGQKLEFYQRGILGGGAQDALDMNVYANEMWLKDYLSAQFMSAFLSLPTVPANEIGEAMLISMLQAAVDLAKYNGVISVGKTLNVTQQLYISQITGDKMAWHQVATLGYWFRIQFLSRVTKDGRTEWYAKYILVYGKDDAIRAVEGQDVLI